MYWFFYLENFQPSTSKTVGVNTSSPIPLHLDNRTVYLNYINSIIADSSDSNYQVNVLPFEKN